MVALSLCPARSAMRTRPASNIQAQAPGGEGGVTVRVRGDTSGYPRISAHATSLIFMGEWPSLLPPPSSLMYRPMRPDANPDAIMLRPTS